LSFEGVDVIEVDVSVSDLEDELVRDRVGYEGDHVSQESVRGDVEGDSESEIGGSLVHDARESVLRARRGGSGREGDIELTEHVTRW
jgi:hypothetical protein